MIPSLRGGEADEAIHHRAIRYATAVGVALSETLATGIGVFNAGAGLLRRCAPRNDGKAALLAMTGKAALLAMTRLPHEL